MGHGEAILVINGRFAAERERRLDMLRNTRIIMAEIRNLTAKKPLPPHKWMPLPGEDGYEKSQHAPEPDSEADQEDSRSAKEVARALFVALGGKLDENGNPIKKKKGDD